MTVIENPQGSKLPERMIERRAIEAVIWGMPAVNYDRMFEAARAASAGPNQIVYWSRPINWMNQTLTPNPNAIYVMPFIDTTSVGPMVMEIPPATGGAIVGSLMDVWQWASRASTRARVANTSSCRLTTREACQTATFPCRRLPIRRMGCCAPTSPMTAMQA